MLRRREGPRMKSLSGNLALHRIGRRPVACDCGGRTPAHTQARARGHADAPRNPSAHRAPADPASIFREGLATMAGRAGPSDPTWGAGHCLAGGLRPDLFLQIRPAGFVGMPGHRSGCDHSKPRAPGHCHRRSLGQWPRAQMQAGGGPSGLGAPDPRSTSSIVSRPARRTASLQSGTGSAAKGRDSRLRSAAHA